MIALACAAGSACSHRRRDTGRDTPYHLLDLCRPSDGRRARRDWRRRGAQLQRRLPPCVYDERPRLPVGLAVGAADQGPRARHSARGLTGRERDLRFRGPGTEGSNPAPSSGESANPRSLSRRTIRAAAHARNGLDRSGRIVRSNVLPNRLERHAIKPSPPRPPRSRSATPARPAL